MSIAHELASWVYLAFAPGEFPSNILRVTVAEQEIDVFDKRLVDLEWEEQRVKLLMTIPGISVVVAPFVHSMRSTKTKVYQGDHHCLPARYAI